MSFILFGPTLSIRASLLATDYLLAGDLAADPTGATAVKVPATNLLFKDTNGNVSFATPHTLPSRYGYWAGFSVTGTVQAGFSYEPIDANNHRFSMLNNAYQSGGGTYTNVCNYQLTGASATRYYQAGGSHVFETAGPGTAGNPITWANQWIFSSGGELLVGSASPILSAKAFIKSTNNGMVLQSGNGNVGCYMANTSGTANWQPFSFCNNGGSFSQIGSITCNATTTSYNTSSDERIKENIAPVDLADAAAMLGQIEVVEFDWRRKKGGHEPFGLIAQALAAAYPNAVHQGCSGDLYVHKKDPSKTSPVAKRGFKIRDDAAIWGIDPSKLVPLLIAGFQHLSAENEDLRRRLDALGA
jgi:Chaperone of endosialidase